MKRAFFIDRDGTLNEEVDYLHEPEKALLIPGAAEAVKKIHQAGFLAVIITNQAGVAKRYFPSSDVEAVHVRLQSMLLKYGADALIDGWYSCFHHKDFTGECGCRKPHPGMIYHAAADFGIDIKNSFMIGDRISDLQAGVNAGCRESMLVLTGYGKKEDAEAAGFRYAADLSEAVDKLLT